VPTYQYACTACGHELEAVQSFSDDPLTQCPECEGRLRKLFGSVGVVFKGPGFYRTDSRSDSRTTSANGAAKRNGDGTDTSDGKSGVTGKSADSTTTTTTTATATATKDSTDSTPKAAATSGTSSSS
jgi:putative FmdB family regulatory protein